MSENKQTRKWRARLQKVLSSVLRLLVSLLWIAGLLVLGRSMVNKAFLADFENERYAMYPEKLLLPLVFGENEVAPYNVGSVAYENEDYQQAEYYFTKALQQSPPMERECSTRINLALSILHQYPFAIMDMQDREQVEKALEVLYKARGVLTANGCACVEVNAFYGHSEPAEALKRDIDEMIKKLLNNPTPPPQPEDGQSGSNSEQQPQENDQDQQGQNVEEPEEDPSGGSEQEREAQESRQQSLDDQLKEQKQNLEEGTYQSGGIDYTYLDLGDTVGFGEGTPW